MKATEREREKKGEREERVRCGDCSSEKYDSDTFYDCWGWKQKKTAVQIVPGQRSPPPGPFHTCYFTTRIY